MDYHRKQKKTIKPLLVIVILGILAIIIFSYFFETAVYSKCTNIMVTGNSIDNVDIVFVANNYHSLLQFKTDVNTYIDRAGTHGGLLSVEPFKSNQLKFNFYSIDEFYDINCNTGSDYLLCDNGYANKIASSCPHDYVIVLSQQDPFSQEAYLRSSAYINVGSINTADNRLVLAHEFGHLFGSLADEYITGEEEVDAPNCDVVTCPKWYGKFDGVGCFKGCTNLKMYRSTENSIMRDYSISNEYGPVNEDALLRRML